MRQALKRQGRLTTLLHGQVLESVPCARYLRVDISRGLTWDCHTANKTLGNVKRNVITKNKDIKTTAYNSLVRPQFEYTSAVWSP